MRNVLAKCLTATLLLLALVPMQGRAAPSITYVDEGAAWTQERRTLYYQLDQGSQLIPLAWFQALKQADGTPFLDGSLARYGFLPMDDPKIAKNLPIGFAMTSSDQGTFAGLACAACHTRDIEVGKARYRIDGAPAIIDFARFFADLDVAMGKVRDDPETFKAFAAAVLGDTADASAVAILRAGVDIWWVRYHTFIGKSLPRERLWGPARMDAISLIYNRLAGLDLGPPPTYLIPDNIKVGDAPVRFPFLWNSPRQDMTQWTGFAANGNDFYALTRNLGQEYGVFGTFHPQKTTATFSLFNRNYIAVNSANIKGLDMAENLLRNMGPPVWPFTVDTALAEKGKAIFERPAGNGGCAECHGMRDGDKRANAPPTLKTPVVVVGTDTRAWQIVMRDVDSGSLEGATIPGLVTPIGKRDMALTLLRAAVVGAVGEAKKAVPQVEAQAAAADSPKARIHDLAKDEIALAAVLAKATAERAIGLGPEPPPPLITNGYEARVLQGIWAAAPYLHNGSVPTLDDLLKPPAERPKSFKVGLAFDPAKVGLAAEQSGLFDFTQTTTGCEDVKSGDSNCGHAYGTSLSAEEKKALLEYLKVL